MCNGIILNNGQVCPHERKGGSHSGDCDKRRLDICHADHEWCDICESWYGEDMKCECEEE